MTKNRATPWPEASVVADGASPGEDTACAVGCLDPIAESWAVTLKKKKATKKKPPRTLTDDIHRVMTKHYGSQAGWCASIAVIPTGSQAMEIPIPYFAAMGSALSSYDMAKMTGSVAGTSAQILDHIVDSCEKNKDGLRSHYMAFAKYAARDKRGSVSLLKIGKINA